jgi:hypothetical protein
MSRLLTVFILALLCVSFVRADSDVVILNPDNFDSEVASSGITLVEFFAPCKYNTFHRSDDMVNKCLFFNTLES